MHSDLKRLGRREWWLWFSAVAVTTLSGLVFLLSLFHSLFLHSDRFFEIRADQARWGTLCLLLLFNVWLVYRQRSFRRQRKQLTEQSADLQEMDEEYDPNRLDPVTGFYTRASLETPLGKEVARARRRNTPLSLVAVHLDDLAQIAQRHGKDTTDLILKEFAQRLKKASRGADFGARLSNEDLLLVLPECSLKDARTVSDRLGHFAMKISGREIAVTYSLGWINYKAGEVPSDLIRRAGDVLQLYKKAGSHSPSEILAVG